MGTKTTTPASTTVKVAAITGAAKDEKFLGITEDHATLNLNVLANDPGSARIWSLNQNALLQPAGSQMPEYLSSWTLASGAVISLNADGTVHYDGAAAMQHLRAGVVHEDSFIYTIRMANGALSTATATVSITGENDAAVFSGDFSGSLTEDDTSVNGLISVFDIDDDESGVIADSQSGEYGAFAIDSNGNWSYQLDQDMNYLAAGESVSEEFTVVSIDGTSQLVTQTVLGVNDIAEFSGDTTGSVTEDDAISTNGTLVVTDADQDQSGFQSTGNLNGTYGDFTFDLLNGDWSYTLRNTETQVQALVTGETVHDSLQVTSIDGTEFLLGINIGGKDEPVVVGPEVTNQVTKWNVNKINVTKSGGGLDSALDYDVNGVARIAGFDGNDELHVVGAMHKESPFLQLVDTDNNGSQDSTMLNFDYAGGHGETVHVDVILIGYMDFNTDTQLF